MNATPCLRSVQHPLVAIPSKAARNVWINLGKVPRNQWSEVPIQINVTRQAPYKEHVIKVFEYLIGVNFRTCLDNTRYLRLLRTLNGRSAHLISRGSSESSFFKHSRLS